MTPQQKADYYMQIFNNDVAACIRMCQRMISTCFLGDETEYFHKVKEILENGSN